MATTDLTRILEVIANLSDILLSVRRKNDLFAQNIENGLLRVEKELKHLGGLESKILELQKENNELKISIFDLKEKIFILQNTLLQNHALLTEKTSSMQQEAIEAINRVELQLVENPISVPVHSPPPDNQKPQPRIQSDILKILKRELKVEIPMDLEIIKQIELMAVEKSSNGELNEVIENWLITFNRSNPRDRSPRELLKMLLLSN